MFSLVILGSVRARKTSVGSFGLENMCDTVNKRKRESYPLPVPPHAVSWMDLDLVKGRQGVLAG